MEPEPFYFEGNELGVLLIHGFTGSPIEMYPMGEYLARQGLTVMGVRLAGHGTTPEEMSKTGWQDWVASAREALERLDAEREQVYVVGYSLGGIITLHLASRCPIDGAVLLATPLYQTDWRQILVPFAKYFVRYISMGGPESPDPAIRAQFWSYDRAPVRCMDELLRFMRPHSLDRQGGSPLRQQHPLAASGPRSRGCLAACLRVHRPAGRAVISDL
jgi:carboxylesterase